MISLLPYISIEKIPIQNYLSKKEVNFYKRIPANKRKDWLAGRYNIKKVIGSYFLDNFQKQIEIKEIEIIPKKFKKPTYGLPTKRGFKTNICISHCNGLAIGAISENKKNGLVGVDIEKIRKFNNKLLQEFLLPEELKYIKKAKPSVRPFLKTLFWSLKESYLKAIGKGLVYHPKFVRLKIDLKNKTCKLYDKNKKIKTKIEWEVFKRKYIITKVNII